MSVFSDAWWSRYIQPTSHSLKCTLSTSLAYHQQIYLCFTWAPRSFWHLQTMFCTLNAFYNVKYQETSMAWRTKRLQLKTDFESQKKLWMFFCHFYREQSPHHAISSSCGWWAHLSLSMLVTKTRIEILTETILHNHFSICKKSTQVDSNAWLVVKKIQAVVSEIFW